MDTLDRIKGSLLGGAAGDALGYPVEFVPDHAIRDFYGPEGITAYRNGQGWISDDTQMTLFTAAGILSGDGFSGVRHRVPRRTRIGLSPSGTISSSRRRTARD